MSDTSDIDDQHRPQDLEINKELVNRAEGLLFFREIALGVFHQVANYLNLINSDLLMIEFLCNKESNNPTITEHLNQLKNASKNAMNMVHTAQKRGESLRPVSRRCLLVIDVVMPAISYAKKRADASGITIKHTLTKKDYEVYLDDDLAKEAIINILNNAFWALKENKKSSKKEIFIATRELPDENAIKIEITDSGIGIEHESYIRLFEPFFTTRPGGTGLGLFFARKLFDEFGGHVSVVKSHVGKGTTVEIKLPIKAKFERYS